MRGTLVYSNTLPPSLPPSFHVFVNSSLSCLCYNIYGKYYGYIYSVAYSLLHYSVAHKYSSSHTKIAWNLILEELGFVSISPHTCLTKVALMEIYVIS